jgi:hypothetical protein
MDLTNRSSGIALATDVTLRYESNKARVLPAYQSDNFVSLLAGEKRHITVEVPGNVADARMQVALRGWNVSALTIPVRKTR